jgi:DNA topoisomerase-1
MDDITFEQALDLFKLPRKLGAMPDGEAVTASIGRFGPYVRYGSKFVSIREDDPYTITLERAIELVEEKKRADASRLILDFPEQGIQVLNGRYGPYVTNGKKNAKIPKDRDPKLLTLEECEALIAAAPERTRRGAKKKAAASEAPDAADESKPQAKKKKRAKSKKKTGQSPAEPRETDEAP